MIRYLNLEALGGEESELPEGARPMDEFNTLLRAYTAHGHNPENWTVLGTGEHRYGGTPEEPAMIVEVDENGEGVCTRAGLQPEVLDNPGPTPYWVGVNAAGRTAVGGIVNYQPNPGEAYPHERPHI